MGAGGCILYLLHADKLWLEAGLERAQKDALVQRLPLAVVTCVEPEAFNTKLPYLQQLEKTLDSHNLPLIVLIGTQAATLPSLVKHARPVQVYGQGSGAGNVALTRHPYAWPGVVIKTKELKVIVDNKNYMC